MPCQPFGTVITALGFPLTFQEPVAAITAAMNERARKAFGKHSKLLCAPTPIKGRLRMHTTMVRNAALWGATNLSLTRRLVRFCSSGLFSGGVRTRCPISEACGLSEVL